MKDQAVYFLENGEFHSMEIVDFTVIEDDVHVIEEEMPVLVANPFGEVSVEFTIDGLERARLTRIFGYSNNYRRYHGMRAIRWRKICRR